MPPRTLCAAACVDRTSFMPAMTVANLLSEARCFVIRYKRKFAGELKIITYAERCNDPPITEPDTWRDILPADGLSPRKG